MDPTPPAAGRQALPSPATAISLVALFVALAGTAAALPGKGSVSADDIRRNAVTGKHVKERTLAAVPNARAVGGQRVAAFRLEIPDDEPEQTFRAGGIRIDAECNNGAPTMFAAKVRDLPAVYHAGGFVQDPPPIEPYGLEQTFFVAGDSEPLAQIGSNAGQVTAHVLWSNGRSTQIDAAYRNVPPGGGSVCVFWGRVTSD